MISVYKSETGQFVLLHTPTESVIIDDNLSSAYSKLVAHLKEHHPGQEAEMPPPYALGAGGARPDRGLLAWTGRAALIALVVLPFLWLGTLHSTIAGVVNEIMVRFEKPGPDGSGRPDAEVAKKIEKLQAQIAAIKPPPTSTSGQEVRAAIEKTAELERALNVFRQELLDLKQRTGQPEPAKPEGAAQPADAGDAAEAVDPGGDAAPEKQ